MVTTSKLKVTEDSRSPYGERGLKYARVQHRRRWIGRSPYGERGLKFVVIAAP